MLSSKLLNFLLVDKTVRKFTASKDKQRSCHSYNSIAFATFLKRFKLLASTYSKLCFYQK